MRNPRHPKPGKATSGTVSPLARLRNHVTDRDRLLLGWLYDHHTLTTAQIAHALFSSLDFAQRRLRQLTDLQAVARFRPNKLDGGSYPYHYILDQVGFTYIMGERDLGLPRRDEFRRRQQSVLTRPDLRHLLGSNQFFIDLAAYARTHPGAVLEVWQPASAYHSPGSYFRTGDSMSLAATGGARLPRPDAAGVWRQDGRAVPFFLEYDTGSERLETLCDKVFKYATLATATKWAWPALFLLPSQRREDNLHLWMSDYLKPPNVLWYTTNTELLALQAGGPAAAVWRPGGPLHRIAAGPQRLIDLVYIDNNHDQQYKVTNPHPTTRQPVEDAAEPDDY